MKTNYKFKTLILATTVLFTISCLAQVLTRDVYATSNVQELLITEVMPMSNATNDAYEYIEIYNNSDRNIDIKDYKLPSQNVDITTSKVISPKGILVVCTKGSTTLDSFNAFYNTTLTADKYITLPFVDEVLSNNLATSISITRDDTTVVVKAQYNTTDFQAKKGVTYMYADTGFNMLMLGINQNPTPGNVSIEQVPQVGTKVTGITLDKTLITMDVNQTAVINATIAPVTATNKSIVWTTSNSNIIEVSQKGIINSKAEGVAYVTATTVDGGIVAVCTVNVKRIPVTGITLDKTLLTMDINQNVVLYATIAPATATNKTIIWTSSNSSIVEVTQNGMLTSKTEGVVYVTATAVDGGIVAVCTVTVKRIPVTGITLDKTTSSILVGKSIALTASVTPTNATNKLVSFESSNSNIATVDSKGIVVGKAIGEALITVTTKDGYFKNTCVITVKDNKDTNNEISNLRLNKKSIQIKEGKFEQLKPIITPGNLKKTGLIWKSSDETVAIVSKDGRVFGKKEGTAIITVTTVDGKYVAKCNVKITTGKDKDKDKGDDDDDDHKGKGKGKDRDKD